MLYRDDFDNRLHSSYQEIEDTMKHLIFVSMVASCLFFGVSKESFAALNCSVCSDLAYCRSSLGAGGSCSRSCSGGVCACIVVENPNC